MQSARRLRPVIRQCIQSQRCMSSQKGKKESMKQQMEMLTPEEQVKQKEQIRSTYEENDGGQGGRMSVAKVFWLSFAVGTAYALFQNYSLSGVSETSAAKPIEEEVQVNQKEEITVIRRRRDTASS